MLEKDQEKPGNKRAYVYSGYCKGNNYIAGSAHNLYSFNCGDNHKNNAPQHDLLTDWSDERIQAILRPERRQAIADSVFEVILFALFGAMLVLAYFS